jgi:hypothetical protein
MITLISVMIILAILARAPRAAPALAFVAAAHRRIEPSVAGAKHFAPSHQIHGIATCPPRAPPSNARMDAVIRLRCNTPQSHCANAGLRDVLLMLGNVLRSIQRKLGQRRACGSSEGRDSGKNKLPLRSNGFDCQPI